jgi:hypothetical protein
MLPLLVLLGTVYVRGVVSVSNVSGLETVSIRFLERFALVLFRGMIERLGLVMQRLVYI